MTANRVLIVDDHPIAQRGIAAMMSRFEGYEVVGAASDATTAQTLAEAMAPDIILLDLRIGEDLAPSVIPDLKVRSPASRILIITGFDDGELIRQCLVRGADGVVLKDADSDRLEAALDAAMAGRTSIDPRLSATRARHERLSSAGYDPLSDREFDVLLLLARGMNTADIARELSLKPNTIRSYLQTMLTKLQAKNRVMAVATARRLRLI